MVLVDNTLGVEEAMTVGDSYEFNNTTTTNNSRFLLKFTDLTGVEVNETNNIQVLVAENTIYIKGCNGGEEISLYTSTGMLLTQTISQSPITELETLVHGVLLVKIDDKVFKVVKK